MIRLLPWCWGLFFGWWIFRARGNKADRIRESFAARWGQTATIVAAWLVITAPLFNVDVLGLPIIPERARSAVEPFLVLVVLLGIGIAIWAREHLGRNWSVRVTVKEGHELIRTGPYARIRHPIYTGILLATLANAFAIGRVHALVGFGILFVGFWFKSRKEERWMGQEFGERYAEYRKVSGRFLPRVASRGW
jgi:protein-S-isoprenylcysteine O-methyltransferase Ste14